MKQSKLLTIPQPADRMLPAPTHLHRLFVALMVLLTMTSQTAWADDVNIEATGQTISDDTTWENCTVNFTGSGTVTFSKRISISGNVTLNLGTGITLNANKGIAVNEGNSLTIDGTGTLNANITNIQKLDAAIGGDFGSNAGTIIINGGTINASGINGAAIGGGYNGNGGIITITGGNITATAAGNSSAGIGGGLEGNAGTISITGGVINVSCGKYGAGIGGGATTESTTPAGGGGTIAISGGQITVTSSGGYGIGAGKSDYGNDGAEGTISLSWSESTDFISASSYVGDINFVAGKRFYYYETTDYATKDGMYKQNRKIVPAIGEVSSLAMAEIRMPRYYITTSGTAVNVDYSVYDYNENELTLGTDYTAVIRNSSNAEVTTFDQLGDYTLTVTGKGAYTGSKSYTFSLVGIDPGLTQDGSEYYVNFPNPGRKTISLSSGQTIKVYDSEGKSGNVVAGDGFLMLYAPEGCALEVTGKIDAIHLDSGTGVYTNSLNAYEGEDESVQITSIDRNSESISFASGGNKMLLRFYAPIVYTGHYGLDLTVRVIQATPHTVTKGTCTNGDITIDKTSVNTNETVTLTVNPASGYLLKRITITDTDNSTTLSTIGEDHWYSEENTVTFKMPNKNVNVTPEFTNDLSATNGLALQIDPLRVKAYTIPEIVKSFNITGSANNNSSTNAVLKAHEGYRLQATGNVDFIGSNYDDSEITIYDGANTSATLLTNIKGKSQDEVSIGTQTSSSNYMTIYLYEDEHNAVFTGKISIAPIQYSIGYDLAGGSVATENPTTYTIESDAITLNNPTKDGYTFAGWTGTDLGAATTSVTIAHGSTGDRSYTATWNIITYNITYNGVEGATNPNPASYTIESEAITLDTPTKDGYTFAGWFDNAGFTGSAVTTIAAGSTGDKTLWAKWIQDLTYGGVTIKDNGTTKSATLDASQEDAVSITSDVVVNAVELNRDFTANQPATVMLPFSLADGQTVSGGSFYKFSGVTKDGDVWKAQFTEVATLKANTPYLFNPSATGQVTFDLNGGTVTLNTTTTGEAGSTASNWEFCGTYQKVQWAGTDSDPSDLSKTYGFAKGNATIAAGQFVHFAAGAWLKPMRCYLVYNGSTEGGTFQNAPSRTRGAASTEELPQTITVVLMSSIGETTAIGTLDTKTGDITLDGWYTMDGRKLEGKPTKKGLYINNGRKIVIK